MLSVTPAFADTKPAAQTQDKPSVAELEKIAELAQKAYEDAVAAESAARVVLEAALSETAPLAVLAGEAKKAAEEAAAAKTAADQAVVDAQTAVDTATPEEKAAAEKALADAEAAAAKAAEAQTAADEKAKAAGTAADDARVAAVRVYGQVQKALKEALAAKTAADEALARAKEEEAAAGEECVPEADLTTVVTGLPSEVVAGTTTAFSLRVTNGTDKAMDEVLTFASVHATDSTGLKDIDKLVRLQWSTESSPKWKNVKSDRYIDAIGSLKAGDHADVKMRLKVDASAPAGNGITFFAGDYFNEDGSCGGTPDLQDYTFDIKADDGKPGKADDDEPAKKTPDTSDPKPQGSTSGVPVNTTTGSLAATGSSSAMSQIALAGGAAMVIGAGAVFIVRRRTAGSDA